ncbi:hypothetical protein [Neorhizobium sp. T25_13]|uniref:hypothetical protein n=1 Tax=Neorhizobium sp. T25_13 TaxID=2093830 RepID=UPI00155E67C7|nr:hypothetical protein [Neorhizobium sp. T25_13]
MDKFLQIIGALICVAALSLMVFIMSASADRGDGVTLLLGMLPFGIPAVIGGVVLAAFGSMLEQLKAIRASLERQERP